LSDEQKDFLGELTPASQLARYVDVAVGLPRDIYSKRLVEEYLNKALPIIDTVKARVTKASQT
jgi:HEPN domain-containing protein